MDLAAETYRVKVHRDNSPSRPCRAAKNPSCCPRPKKGKKGSRGSRKGKDPSLDTLTQNLSANCCTCCSVLAQYLKEVGKLICSCLNEKPTESRVCELLIQMAELTWCLGTDCLYLLKYVLRFLCVYKK